MSALMPLVLALALAGVGYLLFGPGAGVRRRLAGRARGLSRTRGEARPRPASTSLFKPGDSRLDGLARRFLPRPKALKTRLEATGAPIGLGRYGLASLAVLAAAAAVLHGLGASLGLSLFAGLAAATFLPHAATGVLIARRRNRFLKLFPEAIALIVRGLRAGLPVTESVAVVGREIADPVGEEFRRASDQVRLGLAVEQALWQAARRVDLPELNFLVISLSVQRETGGNLAETLENLEQTLRRRQQMRLKVKAMSSEATASALIIGCLPFVMAALMSVCSPDYLRVLFTSPLGQMLLSGAGASLLVGAVVMRQMVRFEA
jgi:tight adherence protein B